jgi:hypothetical protein
LSIDEENPVLTISAPVDGRQSVAGEVLFVTVSAGDNSGGIKEVRLFDDQGLIAERGGKYQPLVNQSDDRDYRFYYQIPASRSEGELILTAVAEDHSGRMSSDSITLPLIADEAPILDFTQFATFKVGGSYQKVYTEPERLNYGEFWVRIGEDFKLVSRLTDDVSLARYQINRLNRDGSITVEYQRSYPIPDCPGEPILEIAGESAEILFSQFQPTRYEVVVTDHGGQQTRRSFLVHPLQNVAPEIRITVPAEGQYIVAGTFNIEIGVLAADDRTLHIDDLQLFANGIPLSPGTGIEPPGGEAVFNQALDSIYDAFEYKYSIDIADEFGRRTSPNLLHTAAVYSVPVGLIEYNETITLEARIKDSDSAIATDQTTFIGAADEINPEVALVHPTVGYGPPEFSDFTVRYRAYDNVKIDSLELYRTYGAQLKDGTYQQLEFGAPIRTIASIEARDFEPLTTNNIDTPVYTQIIHVDRLVEINDRFADLSIVDVERFDIWLRIVGRDPSGNQRAKDISFPVRVDERPVVDIVSPLDGSRVVEDTDLLVNVNAYDDVGIDSLRLVARAGAIGQETEIYNILLRQPPYSFSVALPRFDPDDTSRNRVVLEVEAIDSYGAAFGDLDKHRATERIVVEIIEDRPPEVVIGLPEDGDTAIEGEYVLVQINAIDDVAVDHVALNIANLITGDRTLTDFTYPYEFFIEIPYGQAGASLVFTASTTEQRKNGVPRTVQATDAVTLHVEEDTQPPDPVRVILPPQSGATVAEKRSFPYQIEAFDNVRVSTVRVELFVDTDRDGAFVPEELVSQRLMIAGPYFGSFAVKTIDEYLGTTGSGHNQLDMQVVVTVQDGAGNQTVVTRPVTLVRNSAPQVTGIRLLDQRGDNLGAIAEITEGRQYVVSVTASDPEVGVDQVTLYRAIGEGDDLEYQPLRTDSAAPFQFHDTAPIGEIGTIIGYRAKAVDIDGYESELSAPVTFTVSADQPPTATIITPRQGAVIIDGQTLEIGVDARDDLGPEGIDRVLFYINDKPVYTVYQDAALDLGMSGGTTIYTAEIEPPEGVDGFALQAVAYDIRGQSGKSPVVHVGRIDDTVVPKLAMLSPFDGDILTTGEPRTLGVSVKDIGVEEERRVMSVLTREYRDQAGQWQPLDSREVQLFRDDTAIDRPSVPLSEPDNHYYVYWAEFSDGSILRRGPHGAERVRIETRVETPNHVVRDTTVHEVGMPVAERVFLSPRKDSGFDLAKSVYYSAVAQYISTERQGAMVGAWSSHDPGWHEDLFSPPPGVSNMPTTGLFLADISGEQSDSGDILIYSELLNGASEIFAGSISELHADANFVIAAKAGIPFDVQGGSIGGGFAQDLSNEIGDNTETGARYLDTTEGEVLIFNNINGDGQFGLPYQLAGRISLPFTEVYGLDRRDDLVLVANGNGGVQVIDISNLSAPYRAGFIKPNGYVRDVLIKDGFAYIAASHEGVVVADITSPHFPIIATLDTLGIANRLQSVGNTLYVTDMAGDGFVSQFNIIDISDPFDPEMVRSITLTPARADFISDGVYDVFVSGNKGYATVLYSDQEDRQVQSVVEIVDLQQYGDPSVDATIPAVIHRHADSVDFSLRDITLARGGIQVAAGRAGINRLELTELAVLDHTPATDQRFVPTDLGVITIELSAVLPGPDDPSDPPPLDDFFEVYEGGVVADGAGGYSVGENISDRFAIGFGMRGGEPAYRFVELTTSDQLRPGSEYVVVVKQGLQPLTGVALSRDYLFSFFTSPAGAIAQPDIVAIGPDSGPIGGGTELVVEGTDFGANPSLYLGGLPLVISEYLSATQEDGLDRIVATTIPNVAGPAAVQVVTADGLEDTVIGGFTYLDNLHISFINPAVVDVSQAGENDVVEIVGYGFDGSVELRAFPTGHPEDAVVDRVDDDRLSLHSPTSMRWVVPDFGYDYRGYVDVEISDPRGRYDYAPQALFYGQLSVQRRIELEQSPTTDTRDPSKLPIGRVMGLAGDAELGYLFVLGQGYEPYDPYNQLISIDVKSHEELRQKILPSWLEIVHYSRDQLEEAAPMVGLGYYDLPQELSAISLALAESTLYVSAGGPHFPYIDTEYEGRNWLLVYDREDRLPGELVGDSKDRDILYALPLPLKESPTAMVVKDDLLIANGGDEGILIIGIADPLRPVLLRHIEHYISPHGTQQSLSVRDMAIRDTYLSVITGHLRIIFDLSKPGIPQLDIHSARTGRLASLPGLSGTAGYNEGVFFWDDSTIEAPVVAGRYQANGLTAPGDLIDLDASTTMVASLNRRYMKCGRDSVNRWMLNPNLFDISRLDNMLIQDSLMLLPPPSANPPFIYTDDGLLITYDGGQRCFGQSVEEEEIIPIPTISLIDTFVLDLADSYPAQGQSGVSRDSVITLRFTQPIRPPSAEHATAYLSRYLALLYDDGTDEGAPVECTVDVSSQSPHLVTITPAQILSADSRYRLVLRSDPADGGRRSLGLFDYTLSFTTGSGFGPDPRIISVAPHSLTIDGGELTVVPPTPMSPPFSSPARWPPSTNSMSWKTVPPDTPCRFLKALWGRPP